MQIRSIRITSILLFVKSEKKNNIQLKTFKFTLLETVKTRILKKLKLPTHTIIFFTKKSCSINWYVRAYLNKNKNVHIKNFIYYQYSVENNIHEQNCYV